jgi:hypothetical protein
MQEKKSFKQNQIMSIDIDISKIYPVVKAGRLFGNNVFERCLIEMKSGFDVIKLGFNNEGDVR